MKNDNNELVEQRRIAPKQDRAAPRLEILSLEQLSSVQGGADQCTPPKCRYA